MFLASTRGFQYGRREVKSVGDHMWEIIMSRAWKWPPLFCSDNVGEGGRANGFRENVVRMEEHNVKV